MHRASGTGAFTQIHRSSWSWVVPDRPDRIGTARSSMYFLPEMVLVHSGRQKHRRRRNYSNRRHMALLWPFFIHIDVSPSRVTKTNPYGNAFAPILILFVLSCRFSPAVAFPSLPPLPPLPELPPLPLLPGIPPLDSPVIDQIVLVAALGTAATLSLVVMPLAIVMLCSAHLVVLAAIIRLLLKRRKDRKQRQEPHGTRLIHQRSTPLSELVGMPVLHQLAAGGDVDGLQQLCRQGSSPTELTPDGLTALHVAADSGNTRCVQALLAAGAGINVTTKASWAVSSDRGVQRAVSEGGLTPLHMAARSGHHDTVRLLLESGANAFATSASGQTAKDLAKAGNHVACVRLINREGQVHRWSVCSEDTLPEQPEVSDDETLGSVMSATDVVMPRLTRSPLGKRQGSSISQ
ncbi:Ankyrin repeats (3 copies) [Carpediemonas membranifera]|uniref:Ankyrin repeats (3 copies) n=1 Tax=Carpediemonas membranifera TaxID=201153 RepID=A0A8J6AZN0_9EUKA|nr:Ankyrin repeats (3 copies) [Carpediemonas membranifera]|eukprot:KAG9395280.1 Ankyrin repeats (3 copies) [Carpediemonas membranifera]